MLTKNFHQPYDTRFIGYLAKQKDLPDFIESEYGIPSAVSRIAESIFEELPPDEAAAFFAALPAAIQCNGKNLTRVCWQFLAAELRSLPPVEPEIQVVINLVIDGMDLLAEGREWPEEDASAAASAASWAVRAAARAADWVANAAARAAYWAASEAGSAAASAADWAAIAAGRATAEAGRVVARVAARVATRRRQRDLLLKLIAEAPITQQENN